MKTLKLVVALVATLLLFLSCDSSVNETAAIDGLWVSDGYGLFAEIEVPEMTMSEVTAISCLGKRQFRLERSGENQWDVSAARGTDAIVDVDDGSSTLVHDPNPLERFRVQIDAAASDIVFARSESPPAACTRDAPSDALLTFDVFWQTFADHYPFFERKGIDWEAERVRHRAQLSESTSNRRLFDVLVAMIEPLQDNHVYLEGSDVGDYSGFRQDEYDTDGKRAFLRRARQAEKILQKKYLTEPLHKYARGNVFFGRLQGNVGYLRITSFSDFGKGTFTDQLRRFEAELDEIFDSAMAGLIIDVRVNFGGSDNFGLAIAERLAVEPYVAYRKVARNDPNEVSTWTDPQTSTVQPRRPGFEGAVVLLTSRYTISAGETFTQALMGRRPEVVRIGKNTQGVFSDVLSRKLPNGWKFGLPNELFLDEQDRFYDGPGIAPHHPVAIFARADLKANRDPAIEKALEVIQASAQ